MDTNKSLLFCFVVILQMSVAAFATPEAAIMAITTPSADVTLAFVQPGRIAAVPVKQGQRVTKDQLLVQQDTAAEEAHLLQIKAQSEDTTQIEAAQASLDQKKIDFTRLEWAFKRNSATKLEFEHSRLDVKIAELSLKVAEFEHQQSIRKYNEVQIRVDNMSLKSPITGTIDKVEVEVGESVNGLTEVVRVVKTDPLWIDVPVPLTRGRTLRLEQTVEIIFPGTERETVKGEIIYISTVADAASSTLPVRVEVSNKSNRPAGEHIQVVFSK